MKRARRYGTIVCAILLASVPLHASVGAQNYCYSAFYVNQTLNNGTYLTYTTTQVNTTGSDFIHTGSLADWGATRTTTQYSSGIQRVRVSNVAGYSRLVQGWVRITRTC